MKQTKVITVVDLRDDLLEVYNGLRNKTVGAYEAKQAANVSGKIMATAKAQMEYNKRIGSSDKPISFMNT